MAMTSRCGNGHRSHGFATAAGQPAKKRSKVGLVLVSGIAVAALGGGYMYRKRLQENRSVTAKDFHDAQQPALDSAFPKDEETLRKTPFVFYRYTTCPFCGKVKAFLDYYSIPYIAVEVEPMFKGELHGHGYTKVPQLQIGKDGPILVDSDEIVERLAKIVKAETKEGGIGLWRSWARERLVRFLVININKSLSEAFEGYTYIDRFDTIPTFNKYFLKFVGAPVMFMVAQYVTKPKLLKLNEAEFQTDQFGAVQGVRPYDAKEDERQALYREIALWTEQGLQGHKFHGGDLRPDVADLDVYGVLQSIRGHKIYTDLCEKNNRLRDWLTEMDHLTRNAAV